MRIAVGLEYLGSNFHGWQIQSHDPNTIQARVESALSTIAGEEIKTICAGRTDAGVHALDQVVHFDTSVNRPLRAWVRGANRFLPDDIAIQWAQDVSDDFHARYSAEWRKYQYWIQTSKVRFAVMGQTRTRVYYPLDAQLMQAGADCLLGEQDFTSFRAQDCQAKTPNRCVLECVVQSQGECVVLEIKANAFLKHMVRNIVGTLLMVGQKKRPPEWVAEVLSEKNRAAAGPTAPATGLFLTEVSYPDQYGLSKPLESQLSIVERK